MYNKGSAEFNELINKSGGNALKTRFTFSDFSIEKFTKLEYYGGSNNSDDIAIGTTNMAYLDVSAITDKVITNQEFLFEVGMELSDGTIEYAPMGYFKVQSPDSDEDIVNFKAYDRMQKFEKPYVSSLTYPTNSSQILNELCTMCGVELATPIANPITITDKLEGYTCREVLGYIAGIHGFFACFDRYGKLNLRWYSETPIEKQIGLIWALTKSQGNYTVEKITLAKDTETTYTSGTGISGINHSNPYATQEIADSVYTSLGNFTYRPCEISMLDDIRLDAWDILKVTYLDGSVLTIPVMSLEHSFTSGETRVKSVGKTDTENEYSYSGPVTQAMDRMATELLVANRVIATKVDAEWVNANTVTADKIEATNARVSTLEANSLTAEKADLRYATITNLNAQTARIEDLEATALTADSAIITNLQTGKLNTSDLNAEVAKLGYLTANSADLKYANITFGNIDTANIDVANIGLLFTKVGLIDRATIVDGHITGYLDAVEINANNITAGTLIADRILIKGSENGLLYALNNLGEVTSTAVDTLDGSILTKRTVTADKLIANSITANELDVTNIFGNSAVLSTIFAQDITATGTIVGATLKGTNAEIEKGKIGGFTIQNGKIGYLESADYQDLNTGTNKTGYWNSFIINPETYTVSSENGKKVMWFGAHPITNGDGVGTDGYYTEDALFYPFYIDSSGELVSQSDNMSTVLQSGKDYGFNSTNYAWQTTVYSETGYPKTKLYNGAIDFNNVTLTASGFKYKDTNILNFNINGIYSPKINADNFACPGTAEIQNLKVKNIIFLEPVYISSYLNVGGAVKANGNIQSSSDVIAGLGTSNQVSLQSHTHDYFTVKGNNTISSTSNDTTYNWGAQGNSVHFYTNSGLINDQPSTWGYLVNFGSGSEVHQLWMTQSSGNMCHRGGNASGWNGTWRTLLDSSNYTSYCTPSNIGAIPKSCHWDMGTGYYADNDTHWCELGYIDFNGYYDTIVLLITTEFWGNQHGSAHLLYIRGTTSSGGDLYFTAKYSAIENGNRMFKYKKVGKRLYLYMYHVGGNSYARIGITQLQALSVEFTPEYVKNVSVSGCSDFGAADIMGCGVYVQNKNAIGYNSTSETVSNVSMPSLYFGEQINSSVRTIIRGSQIYLSSKTSYYIATNTHIMNISDARMKNDIEELNADYENTDKFIKLWDRINPKEFKMKYNDSKLHIGYVAQDFIEEMEKLGLDYENAPIIGISTNEQIGEDGFNSIDENSEYFDELYTVDYNECAMLTTLKLKQVVNEILPMMQKEINTLKEQNELLKEQIRLLKEEN